VTGKIVGIGIVAVALIAGAMIYYLQEYAFYNEVTLASGDTGKNAVQIELVSLVSGQPEVIPTDDFQGIDSDSSPIRFRACFTIPLSDAMLTETYQVYVHPEPLTGPDWFSCYDAKAIGRALEQEKAIAFLSHENIHSGVDRVIAVFPDGRAFAWHQLNETFQEKAPFDAQSAD